MCSVTSNNNGSCPCADIVNEKGQCIHCHRSLIVNNEASQVADVSAAAAAAAAAEIERLKAELQEKNEVVERLQQDLETLNQKYVSGINRVAEVQHEKDLVEHELEELSCKLFEQANGMVAAEKREKWLLSQQLQEAEEHLKAEKSQLQELRERMMKEEKQQQQNHGSQQQQLQQQQSRTASMPPPPPSAPVTQPIMSIDEFQLESFREFVRSSRTKKISQSAYMNHCLAEDVLPCLRFGPQSRLSAKKLNTFLSRQPCFIEHNHQDIPTPVSTFSSATTALCMACGRSADHSPLKYRFRVDEMDEWAPIDQYCRDRLVAVCEFYVFVRNIQMNLYADRAIDDLYTENIRLRLQMFYSRYVWWRHDE
ncbi:hypothetical protein BX666DRAFT_2155754 [Dichotomocladium elegans]|nr:hypothetical protein BX666DRAFT_2155754 [Dichotomocladium elegans]